MNRAHLFRLGMDLETGATHEEETTGDRAICAVAAGASMTQPAPTIAVAARGPSPSGAVLDNGAPPDGPFLATSENALRGAPASEARIDRASEVGDALLDPARHDHFIRRGGKVFAGVHLIIEVIDGRGLDDEARVQQAFRDCITASGATLLHIHTHKFSPQGVSGVAVLSESHISVHTWPEIGYGAFDVFMCGDADPWASVPVLKRAFQAREVRVQEFLRGEGLVD